MGIAIDEIGHGAKAVNPQVFSLEQPRGKGQYLDLVIQLHFLQRPADTGKQPGMRFPLIEKASDQFGEIESAGQRIALEPVLFLHLEASQGAE